MRSRLPLRLAAAGVVAVSVAAFAGSAAASTVTTRPSASKPSGSITVFGAASLTGAFTQLGAAFQQKYKGTTVTFNFEGSATLATQIIQGAPADVFASADTKSMGQVTAAHDVAGTPVSFAHNLLEIAVAKGNPKNIKTLADTVKPGVQLELCAPSEPCGIYAAQAYKKANVTVPNVPTGENAKAVVASVTLGQADASIVYVTDVEAAKTQISGVEIPPKQNVLASYPIATVKATQNAVTAKAFVSFVTSPAGQAILARFGFLKP
jgi:molybdate transport system substrate-binding protein